VLSSLRQSISTATVSRFSQTYVACGLVIALAVAVAVASTTGVGVGESWFDEQRMIALTAMVIVSFLCLAALRVPGDKASAAILVVLLLGLLSAALATRPFVAAVDWSVYVLIALLVLTARSASPSAVASTAALVGAIVPTAYVAGVAANYLSSLLLGFPIGAETLLVGFSNSRFPAQLQALTIPLLPLAFRRAPAGLWRAGAAVVAALWWMCFIGSGSRTGWIAIGSVSLFLLLFGSAGRQWLRVQVAFAAAGLVLWLVFFVGVPSVLDVSTAIETGRFSNFASVGARKILIALSVDAALAHPLLGIGPMHFAYVDNGEGAHPHNFWLQLAAEWGIPAALLAGSVAVAFFIRLVRGVGQQTETARQGCGIALLAAVGAWGIGVLADGYMVVPTSQLMSTAILMLAAMWVRQAEPEAAVAVRQRLTTHAFTGVSAVALVVLVALPFTGFGQPTPRERAWRAEHRGVPMWPRFWQQGWIGPGEDATAREELPRRLRD
jgi:O-antigen ligase